MDSRETDEIETRYGRLEPRGQPRSASHDIDRRAHLRRDEFEPVEFDLVARAGDEAIHAELVLVRSVPKLDPELVAVVGDLDDASPEQQGYSRNDSVMEPGRTGGR